MIYRALTNSESDVLAVFDQKATDVTDTRKLLDRVPHRLESQLQEECRFSDLVQLVVRLCGHNAAIQGRVVGIWRFQHRDASHVLESRVQDPCCQGLAWR